MQLFITNYTQKKVVRIVWLDVDTPTGNYVIQPAHAPMILTLTPNSRVSYCLTNGKQESLDIKHGVAHISRNSVVLLVN
jgi:F0F1-type ATP synthase epsilon subunit